MSNGIRVGIDGSDVFTAAGLAPGHWNGWVLPYFEDAEVQRIAEWSDRMVAEFGREDVETVERNADGGWDLVTVDGDEIFRDAVPAITLDDGRVVYSVGAGGWTWQVIEAEDADAAPTNIFDEIAETFPPSASEFYGLAYNGPAGTVIVSEDGGDLLVGLYAPGTYENGGDQIEGLVIHEATERHQTISAVRDFLVSAGVVDGLREPRVVETTDVTHGGEDAIVQVARGPRHDEPNGREFVWLSIEIPDERFMQVRLTDEQWNAIRGAR